MNKCIALRGWVKLQHQASQLQPEVVSGLGGGVQVCFRGQVYALVWVLVNLSFVKQV